VVWRRRLIIAGFVWVRVVSVVLVTVRVGPVGVRVMFVHSRVVSVGVRVVARGPRSVVADERTAKCWEMLLAWPARPRGSNAIKEGTAKHDCFASPFSTPAAGCSLWWLWHG
jgi:hypothetical protein